MKTYICTSVVTYKASNKKGEEAAAYALNFKHKLIKGTRPAFDLLKEIKGYCRLLDKKYPRTRRIEVNFYKSTIDDETIQITIYTGNPSVMTSQPKAAVIYLAELAGEINMDNLESGTIQFDNQSNN